MKTIDINAKEWFDKVNGNSYFAGVVTVDYGTEEEKTYNMPFQYGYGNSYQDEGLSLLKKKGLIDTHSTQAMWRFCKENNIIMRSNIERNCLKRELKNY